MNKLYIIEYIISAQDRNGNEEKRQIILLHNSDGTDSIGEIIDNSPSGVDVLAKLIKHQISTQLILNLNDYYRARQMSLRFVRVTRTMTIPYDLLANATTQNCDVIAEMVLKTVASVEKNRKRGEI